MQPLFFALLCATTLGTAPVSEGSSSLLPEFQSFRDRTPLIQLNQSSGSADLLILDQPTADELQKCEEQVAEAELKAIEERLLRVVVEHPTTSAAMKARESLLKSGIRVTEDGRAVKDQVFVFTVPFNR